MKTFWEMFRIRSDLLDRIRVIAKEDQKKLKLPKANMQEVVKSALDLYEAHRRGE